MKEKNSTKISVLIVLLIIAIIAIIVMGVFIYKLSSEKETNVQKSEELQSQVNSLNETIDDLQEKINTISETIKSNDVKESDEN